MLAHILLKYKSGVGAGPGETLEKTSLNSCSFIRYRNQCGTRTIRSLSTHVRYL